MAGNQRFYSTSTNNNNTRTFFESASTRTSTNEPGTTHQQTIHQNNSDHDQMWRYRGGQTSSTTMEQELERRNLQKLQLAENRRDNNDEHEHAEDARNSLLSKNSSSEDEGVGGDVRPNKKLFPVLSERDELLRKVRSVLNKVSSVNYTRLRKRWLSLMPNGNGNEEVDDGEPRLSVQQLGEVLHMVIAKALDDTIYMHIYAGLMGYVVSRKPKDISNKIRHLINSQIHHELQRLATDKELALFRRSTQQVDITRRKKVTLHRFIAELYCEKACTSKFLYERVTDLVIVTNPVDIDENVECLCVLMTFAGQKLEQVKKMWVEDIFQKLVQRQNETPTLVSKRIQFMILDLVEMKSTGWSPHNKWWSPSVQRAPERERTQSTPTPSSSPSRPIQQVMVPLVNQQQQHQEQQQQQVNNNNSNTSLRSRTRSEGSSNNNAISTTPTETEGVEIVVPIIRKNNNTPNNTLTPLQQIQDILQRAEYEDLQQTQQQRQPPQPRKNQYQQQQQHPQQQHIQRKESQQNQNPRRANNIGELTPNQSRALMALFNKVSVSNVDRIAHQLYEVLTADSFDEAANFIVDKILDDSYYTCTHASLIHRVSCKPNMRNFGLKICSRVMFILEKNPESKEGFQLLAELYKLNMVTIYQVRTALEWLMNCSTIGTINSAMESLVIFLFISGAKLEADVNDEIWMNNLIQFWERKANLVAHNQGRPLCLLRDVIELRQNKWIQSKQPHWIPPTIDLPTIRFEPESLIRLFQSDRMEFLRFITSGTSSLSRIENFCKEALKYAVRFGNCERDPEFLRLTGICVNVLLQQRLIRRDHLQNFLGGFVNEVVKIGRVNFKAWDNFGLIMREVF